MNVLIKWRSGPAVIDSTVFTGEHPRSSVSGRTYTSPAARSYFLIIAQYVVHYPWCTGFLNNGCSSKRVAGQHTPIVGTIVVCVFDVFLPVEVIYVVHTSQLSCFSSLYIHTVSVLWLYIQLHQVLTNDWIRVHVCLNPGNNNSTV